MSRLRFPIVILVTLWLPLQGLAAAAMPFCAHALTGHGKASHHHHEGDSGAGAAAHAGHSDEGLQCNDCGPCHLACAPMMAIAVGCPLVTLSFHFSPLLQTLPSGFVLEQPNPPPLA